MNNLEAQYTKALKTMEDAWTKAAELKNELAAVSAEMADLELPLLVTATGSEAAKMRTAQATLANSGRYQYLKTRTLELEQAHRVQHWRGVLAQERCRYCRTLLRGTAESTATE